MPNAEPLKKTALTLMIAEAQHNAFKRHSLLQEKDSRYREQRINIHYDTRRLALRKAGIVLQLREQRASWLQTVERQMPSEFGLLQRAIWEMTYPHHFDFSAIGDAGILDWLERDKIRGNLIPVFETSFSRTSWPVEPAAGVRIEVTLDRGWIAANGRRAPISEVSLELVEGAVENLYVLAGALGERVALTPQLISRAERGYQLFRDDKSEPVGARRIDLDPEAPPLVAFRKLALSCLTDMQLNHRGALHSDDPEYIHQMRVAIRRLRAAIRIFKPTLPPDFVERVVPRLRELINALGRARDLDVLTAEIVAPALADLPQEPFLADLSGIVTERLYQARSDAARTLSQPEYGKQLLIIGNLLNKPPFAAAPGGADDAARPESLQEFAERRLSRLRKKTGALADKAQIDSPVSLHQLRIGIKHLRYGSEFFGSLNSDQSIKVMVKRLTALQDELGQLNDLANAGATLMTCAKGDQHLRRAVNLIADWHQPRHENLLEEIAGRLKKIRKLGLKKYCR